MGKYFEYDRLVQEKDFCNFLNEKKLLTEYIEAGNCVKVYGRRNFGKTSLVKNIISPIWTEKLPEKRVVLYVDLYSINTLDDISKEITQAFNHAIVKSKSVMDKGMDWFKTLKNIRPVWSPPTDENSFGEFSIKTSNNESVVQFPTIFENINNLVTKGKLEFLIILDEFQEIARVDKAEAKIRHSLQLLNSKIPVIILGSKYHMLSKIFDTPKAPFYFWGNTLELGPIPFEEYTKFINERFKLSNKKISHDSSIYLQSLLFQIPEAINRFCDYLAQDSRITVIDNDYIHTKFLEFVDFSRSIYEENFARFSPNKQLFLLTLATKKHESALSSKSFLSLISGIAKSTVLDIASVLLDQGVIDRLLVDNKLSYRINDPFFDQYLRTYKVL